MQQSLDILQMPTEELSLWLEEQIEQNPMLDWKDCTPLEKAGAYEHRYSLSSLPFLNISCIKQDNKHKTQLP
mgnify:CR=1 FL=1